MFHALYFNIVQRDAEYIAEDGFAGIKSVLRLLEIVRFRIVVHIEGNGLTMSYSCKFLLAS